MEIDEGIIDKVRMSEEKVKKLEYCFGSYGLPSFMDIDSYSTTDITVEEALYKLSKYRDYYKVECAIKEFKDGEVMSFYLVSKSYPQECHLIVYNEPHNVTYPNSIRVISILEALYK